MADVSTPQRLVRFARKPLPEKLRTIRFHSQLLRSRLEDWGWRVPHHGNDRTAYIIGLFGTGRYYLNELMMQSIGERGKYFRDKVRLHPGPTSMIYSGHATLRHASRGQLLPSVTNRIFAAAKARFADLIFIYRHPLDSLLTNWVYWRTCIRDSKGRGVIGILQAYKNTDEFCAELERNFLEFKAFAEGDPNFFTLAPGARFLSFREFVEETELHLLQSPALKLRLEDFMIDPLREFSKIVEVMSVDLDLRRLRLTPPRAKRYSYLAVKEKVARFRDFTCGLDIETKKRMERIGYSVEN
jgi:hypothetical protein